MSFHGNLVIFALLSMGLYRVQSSLRVDPLVQTNVGLIRGLKATDGDYSMFLGIPYGRVQEDNHFGQAFPYPPFEDVFFAQDDTSICPQREKNNNQIGDVDCLHLNVYVPHSASSANKVPVMVYIHGGAFSSGDKRMRNFGPKFLVRHDVILVVMNYRLGPYGFMCLDDPRVPGNQGLKDQLLALRWVKNNIEAFGGDSDKITISGESAGAVSVDLHTLTNKESLFEKAIIQSGTSLSPLPREMDSVISLRTEPDREAHFKLAEALGFEGGNTEETLLYLSTLNSNEVIAKAEEMKLRSLPCVENKFEDVEIFIETDPLNMKAENANNIPILIGTNEDELAFMYKGIDMKDVGDLFRCRLKENFNFNDEELNAMANIVRNFYIGDEEISDGVRTDLIDFESDLQFQHPTQRSIDKYLKNGGTIFFYVFSYIGNRNFMTELNNLNRGASHADELGYLFDIDHLSEPDQVAQDMIDKMTTLWTNFIKFGDPTPETSELLPNKWISVAEGTMNYMNLDSEVQMKSRPFKERMAFWDLFYDTYDKIQKGYGENTQTVLTEA